MMRKQFQVECPISQEIWDMKYRYRGEKGIPGDATLSDTWSRVAHAIAGAEAPDDRARWAQRFEDALSSYEFLPAGRILAGAGTGRSVTLFNCFVMGLIEDDMASIFDNVKQAALTMQQGGGIGHDFSSLRPHGAPVSRVGAEASGPVSFMDVWDAMCRTIMSAGARRGAMMGTMRCDHPDIEEFIVVKGDAARLRNFNLSVLVTDDFMEAVKADTDWDLVFDGRVYKTLCARELWDRILRGAYDYAEPGVIFIDRINALNPLNYCETIYATNPCGEQPLPPQGACLLGSINLARLIKDPFSDDAELDEDRLNKLVPIAVRFLDNCIDESNFPLETQAKEARAKRRIGLGVTGLADALIMCGRRYGSKKAARLASKWMGLIERAAYLGSAEIAAEKGAFPLFDQKEYMSAPHIGRLDSDVRKTISALGLRNGLLTSIAPTGTISLLAGNVSSGVEPVFDYYYTRRVLGKDGKHTEQRIEDYAHRLFSHMFGEDAQLTKYFVTTNDLDPQEHLAMQAALQTHVDSAISKTVNCPEDISFEDFRPLYESAYELGLKGCTAYRPNPVTGSVLSSAPQDKPTEKPKLETPQDVISQDGRQESLPLSATQAPVPAPPPSMPREHDGIVYMSEPLQRDQSLPGYTYKLKWPDSDHAIYVTLNDIIQEGRRRPFEIFINSKNLEHYAWTVALTRMISAVFRRGGDVSFVVEELKAVFDPRGGQWMNGRYVPSLLAAIGGIIEQHMVNTGFITPAESFAPGSADAGEAVVEQMKDLRYCPKCSQAALIFQEGCHTCRNCGFSKCS